MTILAKYIAEGNPPAEHIDVEPPTQYGNVLLARLVGSDTVAELNLQNPSSGWLIYPN